MARKKQSTPDGVRPSPKKPVVVRRDMRRRAGPFDITAQVDDTYRSRPLDAYVRPTNADVYGPLVPGWQEE